MVATPVDAEDQGVVASAVAFVVASGPAFAVVFVAPVLPSVAVILLMNLFVLN